MKMFEPCRRFFKRVNDQEMLLLALAFILTNMAHVSEGFLDKKQNTSEEIGSEVVERAEMAPIRRCLSPILDSLQPG